MNSTFSSLYYETTFNTLMTNITIFGDPANSADFYSPNKPGRERLVGYRIAINSFTLTSSHTPVPAQSGAETIAGTAKTAVTGLDSPEI
ncbi:hypothetical protein DdX_05976 [Ditylenchus destructor]|uniref:Uncharacterized protein n=1 Tax=Ditylenchus destructor TaxID=166010 RepID=A0AAD4N9X3_9BILA|nr:hypothetical protein DdX_05976 [Ditylenchus destructor]